MGNRGKQFFPYFNTLIHVNGFLELLIDNAGSGDQTRLFSVWPKCNKRGQDVIHFTFVGCVLGEHKPGNILALPDCHAGGNGPRQEPG